MKTDDDAFIRVDEVSASLNKANTSNSLLYGLINFDSRPHRSRDSKWYISYKVASCELIKIYYYNLGKFTTSTSYVEHEFNYPVWSTSVVYVQKMQPKLNFDLCKFSLRESNSSNSFASFV